MSDYIQELEKQNDELQQRLAKQQEENIELARQNKFAPKWVSATKVNYPCDPDVYHFKIGYTIIAIVNIEYNKSKKWNVHIYGATGRQGDYLFETMEAAKNHAETLIYGITTMRAASK